MFGKEMTVKEFFEEMKRKGKEDYRILIQYRDDGGDYSGEDSELRLYVDDDAKTVTL